MRKMDADRVEYEQKLERQAQLLDTRAAKIKKLEGIYLFIYYYNFFIDPGDITMRRSTTSETFYSFYSESNILKRKQSY